MLKYLMKLFCVRNEDNDEHYYGYSVLNQVPPEYFIRGKYVDYKQCHCKGRSEQMDYRYYRYLFH